MKLNLIFMRHGHASMNYDTGDHSRQLTEQGKIEVEKTSIVLKSKSIAPDLILISDAKRTTETFEIIKKHLDFKKSSFQSEIYSCDSTSLLNLICDQAEQTTQQIMVIGHNPTLSDTSMQLTAEPLLLNPANAVSLQLDFDQWRGSENEIWSCAFKVQN